MVSFPVNLKSKKNTTHIIEERNSKERSFVKINKTKDHHKKNLNINHTIHIYNFKNKSNQSIESGKLKNYSDYMKQIKNDSDINIDKRKLHIDHFIINKKIETKDSIKNPLLQNDVNEIVPKSYKKSYLTRDDKQHHLRLNCDSPQDSNFNKSD